MLCNLALVISEGLTFVVIFQAARLLNSGKKQLLFQWDGIFAPPAEMFSSLSRGQQFLILLAMAVILQALTSLARYGTGVSTGWFAARCQSRVMPILHRHVLSFSYSCASRFRVGQLANVMGRAPSTVQTQIMQIQQVLSNGLLVLVYLTAVVKLTPWLMLVVVSMTLMIGALQRNLRPRIRTASRAQVDGNRQMAVRMIEDLQMLQLLHSSAALRSSEQRIEAGASDLERHMMRISRLTALLEPVSDLLPVLAAVVIGGLSWLLYRGNGLLLVPNLITFVLIIQRLNIRLNRIGMALNRLAENSGPMQELEEILDPADKQFRRSGGLAYAGFSDRIAFESVTLRYPGRSRAALADLNLELPRGAKLALVGRSGAGKSSLVDLLVGLHTPSSGVIRVDGRDLQTLNLDDWQRHLGVVSQDVQLLNGSIAANIAFGVPGASAEQIAAAARLADAEAFILNLPDGYDTVVGERGFRLSGGQRQRLSLARALLRQPQLLILDEATSALDSLSEARILQTIRQACGEVTVLAVAHRLSSIADADTIVVLERGRVIEQGDHAQLMQRNGSYAELWRRQAAQAAP
ncbi:MAG: ABC transporter ATP-binding protein [Synechococcaceae cyanobacterium]|nr:ABC transporter ATP-binding protein [Synechococcaceae cyanobacterium]